MPVRFAEPGVVALADEDNDALTAAILAERVGGTFWAAQPELPEGRAIVARVTSAAMLRAILDAAAAAGIFDRLCLWTADGVGGDTRGLPVIVGDADPWHLLDQCEAMWCAADDELALLAASMGKLARTIGDGPFAGLAGSGPGQAVLREAWRDTVWGRTRFVDPFFDTPIDAAAAIALLGFWRRLIDGNRRIAGVAGIAFWKREGVEALLWGGRDIHYLTGPADLASLPADAAVAVWGTRTGEALSAALARHAGPILEIEDGFIRSVGLGADCVPPRSIVVDTRGLHFDPRQPSDLEVMIERDAVPEALVGRARELVAAIVAGGISKYGAGAVGAEDGGVDWPADGRLRILVPGQVEDDRSVVLGGGDVAGNLDLLRRVRARHPDAYIVYKPHPDVEAGHRKGAIADVDALTLADRVERGASIASLIAAADAVHVLTSLVGFEALIRGKAVTTHGVPFYAGWGLTEDLGPVPARRTARPSLFALAAMVLLDYPRSADPVTGLPCPPEVLVRRIADGSAREGGIVVALRQWQGRLNRAWSRMKVS